MKFLLDTHTLIWTLLDSTKLSLNVKESFKDVNNQFYSSTISYWEISLKYSLGKFDLGGITPDSLPELAIHSGIKIFDLSANDVASYYKLPLSKHRDLFDRMLIWQSIQNNLTLISKDKDFDNYTSLGLKRTW
jgi:PIN domain nuclease of toxin-antitoxin system